MGTRKKERKKERKERKKERKKESQLYDDMTGRKNRRFR